MPARLLLAAVAISFLVAGGIAAVDAGVQETGEKVTVDSESFMPAAGAQTVLNQSELDGVRYYRVENVTVLDENSTVMVPGEDFVWHQENGTLTTTAGGRLAGDASATITYGFTLTSDTEQALAEVSSNGGNVAMLLVFVMTVGAVMLAAKSLINL